MTFRAWTLAAIVALAGCGGGETAAPPAADTDKAAATTPDAPPQLTADQLAAGSQNIALVPSVIETQSALEAAGIGTKLSDLLTERKFDMKNENKDNVAVRTGVVIADLLLTVKTAPKEKLVEQLEQIKNGLAALEGGADIQQVVTDIQDRVKGDAVTRDELLKELDELSGAVIPELEFNGQNRIVPLIQAGSWLEGANLVAKAVKGSNKPDAADTLLKQPAVVDYFIKYVKTEGAEKAPAAITEKLEESLTILKGLAEKKEPFTNEDIEKVIKTTDDVLALL
jgi:hypothetical protein